MDTQLAQYARQWAADTVTSINNLRLLLKAKGATSLPLYVQLLRERR